MRFFYCLFLYVPALFIVACCSSSSDKEKECPEANCKNYTTQQQAQAAFDADSDCFAALDNDNDGLACEDAFSGTGNTGTGGNGGTGSSGGSGCPTTANCGCSNKTKAQCTGTCCKWIVGTGCVCR